MWGQASAATCASYEDCLDQARKALAQAQALSTQDSSRLAELSTRLENGQTVVIDTDPEAQPRPEWLEFTATARARSAIRHYLKSLGQEDTVALGMRYGKPSIRAGLEALRQLGFEPTDRELEKLSYDIESRDPRTGRLRFIEVKGRASGADTITVTRNEILYSLNKPEDFILAIVEFMRGPGEDRRWATLIFAAVVAAWSGASGTSTTGACSGRERRRERMA